MENPFDIKVYAKNFDHVGYVTDPIYSHFAPSWHNQGYGNFMLDAGHPYSDELQQEGARITVEYRGDMILSGPIRSFIGDIDDAGTVTYQVLDDRRMLENALLLVAPGNPLMPAALNQQGQAHNLDRPDWEPGTVTGMYSYFPWPAGPITAEAAIKHVIKAQMVDRLQMPITIAPNQNRGGILADDVLPKVRMVPLSEVMTPILKASPDLSIRFWQDPFGKTINMDVQVAREWPQPLSLESGTIVSGSYSKRAPDVTRAIVAGPGETAGRAFAGTQGRGLQTPVEQLWGDIIEVLREASIGELNWPDGIADKYKVPKYFPFRGAAADVAEFYRDMERARLEGNLAGAPNTGLSLKLAETPDFSFGGPDGMRLGDKVTAIIRGVPFQDHIKECFLTFSRDNGLVVQPVVGDREADPDLELAQSITNLYHALRRQSAAR
jgi:hypothetical protein